MTRLRRVSFNGTQSWAYQETEAEDAPVKLLPDLSTVSCPLYDPSWGTPDNQVRCANTSTLEQIDVANGGYWSCLNCTRQTCGAGS